MMMTADEVKTVRKWLLYHLDLVEASTEINEFSYHIPKSKTVGRSLGTNSDMVFNSDLIRVLKLLVLEADAEAELLAYNNSASGSADDNNDNADGSSGWGEEV